MTKVTKKNKKVIKKPPPKRGNDKKKKLPRGYKECGSCRKLLHIHKYICDACGFKHDMKKKKLDILKSLNKVTPKLLRSLIQLNDFNQLTPIKRQIPQFKDFGLTTEIIPQELKKRRSSSKTQNNSALSFRWNSSKQNLHFTKLTGNLVCLCPLLEGILVAQSTQKIGAFSESENTTIRAYGLQNFHKLGTVYTGKTHLHYFILKKHQYRLTVHQHIVKLQSFSNRVGMLTGKGTIMIVDFESTISKQIEDKFVDLKHLPELKPCTDDKFTTFEWLKASSNPEKVVFVAGTLLGHIHIYEIQNNKVQLTRFINSAHFETITCISECPLSNGQDCLFASGSYDGTVRIWNLKLKEPIFSMQACNRKICSLGWDPGAKFIFIIRDQNQDSGILACFFAILKSDESVTLSDSVDYRLIKNTNNCKVLHCEGSNRFSMVDSHQCTLRVLEIQDLRKNSLKRKKVKREDEEELLKLDFRGNQMTISASEFIEDIQESKMSQKILTLPRISDACQVRGDKDSVWGITYDGFLFMVNLP